MKKKRSYSDSVHFYGIIWDIAALLVFMMIPVSICLHLNVWPEAKYILKGLLPVAMIFYPVGGYRGSYIHPLTRCRRNIPRLCNR